MLQQTALVSASFFRALFITYQLELGMSQNTDHIAVPKTSCIPSKAFRGYDAITPLQCRSILYDWS